ncbi:HNH endonuclease signature motif containing protein [Gordonia sp. CPCC 205515]|uniref:HNH endonuclease n=1 Tax=Gordonia sp. CPCC 205515 TaxID=3140791 RepID=UPI003AF3A2DA
MPSTTAPTPADLLAAARDLTVTGLTRRQAFDTTRTIIDLSNTLGHLLSVCAAEMDRLGVATQSGGKIKPLLIEMGLAPSVADRVLRIGRGLPAMQLLPGYAEDGVFPIEHLDAIVAGLGHVERRALDGLCDEEKREVESALIAQAASGATPTEITDKARALGNEYATETGGLPAAEDHTLNELTLIKVDGRVHIRGDVDIVTGEKLMGAISSLSKKRPEPDGSEDSRSTARRQSDALDLIVDAAAATTSPFVTRPNNHVNLMLPAADPTMSYLQSNGPVTAATAALLACDAGITALIIDDQTVPLKMGKETRYFPAHIRKAIIIRDQCCIKCGAPARWGHAHHRLFWSEGGPTDLDNGCLLCPSCHADVHHLGWDIIMGADGHPWLIPPASRDPRRQPIPAYNRRTMTLDDRSAA